MYEVVGRNINEAWPKGTELLKQYGKQRSSRNGDVVELNSCVVTIYLQPTERVLFCPVRDANPFFHLFEGLWILAGRNDVAFPSQFAKQLTAYSDNGVTFHAAYGHRMRHHPTIGDQLEQAIDLLKRDPDSRRAVVSIWETAQDLAVASKDLPCNTHLYFKLDHNGQLRMTVCNRSNDIVWGLYGANAVHWSMVMEYVAARLAVPVGTMTTVSDSFHAYLDNPTWKKLETQMLMPRNPYEAGHYCESGLVSPVRTVPLVTDPAVFLQELERFMADPLDELADMFPRRTSYANDFFWRVAEPMYLAWTQHKQTQTGREILQEVNDEVEARGERQIDWLVAGEQWLARREAPVQAASARAGA